MNFNTILDSGDDDLIEIDTTKKNNKNIIKGADLLFNKSKISPEIASSISSISSRSSLSSEFIPNKKKIEEFKNNNSDSDDDNDDEDEDDDDDDDDDDDEDDVKDNNRNNYQIKDNTNEKIEILNDNIAKQSDIITKLINNSTENKNSDDIYQSKSQPVLLSKSNNLPDHSNIQHSNSPNQSNIQYSNSPNQSNIQHSNSPHQSNIQHSNSPNQSNIQHSNSPTQISDSNTHFSESTSPIDE